MRLLRVMYPDGLILGGLLLCIIVMFLVARMARRALQEAMDEGAESTEHEGADA